MQIGRKFPLVVENALSIDGISDDHSTMSSTSGRMWFAVFTQQQREKLAAASLRHEAIGVMLPMVRSQRIPKRRPAPPHKAYPLFPRYLFARFQPEENLDTVRYARGVVKILGNGGIPKVVEDAIIDSIRDRLDNDGYFPIRYRAVEAGDEVVVAQGPFQGLVGRVESELNGGKRVALLLEALDEARVIVEKDNLDLAAEN